MIYWFTGQPGHGKTTLAKALIAQLRRLGYAPHHIDGDDLRDITGNKDYTEEGRVSNVQNAQSIARYLHHKNEVVVVSLVAPYKNMREKLKSSVDVCEIYVHTNEIRGREENHVLNYQYSDLRWDYLLQTINLLSNYGEIYIVRLPVSSKLMSMENKLMPDLNNKINSLNRIISGYINLSNKNHLFNYTDGVHLDKLSAEIATVMILDSIKTIQFNNKK